MTSKVSQQQAGATRDLPLQAALVTLLEGAANDAGIDEVVVYSGGQPFYPVGPRVGSTRHDGGGAADLYLIKDGRELNFENAADRPFFAAFLTGCAARGATGIGAAKAYMGPDRAHVGFGAKAIWGGGGLSANAEPWCVQAVEAGWSHKAPATNRDDHPTLRQGAESDAVKAMQKALLSEGFDCGEVNGAFDGRFGPKTTAELKAFQTARGMNPDAICGPMTWAALGV